MSLDPSRTPVLIGLGQSIERDGVTTAVELAARAAEAAFEDAPGIRDRVQRLTFVSVIFSPASAAIATEAAACSASPTSRERSRARAGTRRNG